MKSFLMKLTGVLCLILVLMDSRIAFLGASYGLALWFRTLLPTLLPFMILVKVLLRLSSFSALSPLLFTALIGLVGGFPMGAKTVADEVAEGNLDTRQGQFLLSFCNLPSPMFLTGFVALPGILPALYLPLPILALLSFLYYRPKLASSQSASLPVAEKPPLTLAVFEKDMMDCLLLITKIGGYMMLFSVMAFFLRQLQTLPPVLSVLFTGSLELTTGIALIESAGLSVLEKGLTAAALCGFGGLCIFAQTKSVIEKACLSARVYLAFKLLHMTLSVLTMYLLLRL